jgi:enoyl-CoA hydratase
MSDGDLPSFETLSTELREHVFLIGLNREAKRNAFNLQMLRELAEAYTYFESTEAARCALLFAHGDHFTAGLDLAEVGPAVRAAKPLFPKECTDPLDLFGEARRKPVVCAVQGYCFTIGIELLLACDVALAAEGTRFRQMEVNRGIMPFGGATIRFPQVAGFSNAMRYLLTGDEFGASEALRMGVVQETCDPSELEARAFAIAKQIGRCAPMAVRATRAAAKKAVQAGEAAALATLMANARGLMETEDAEEGVRSFMERRDAEFQGK